MQAAELYKFHGKVVSQFYRPQPIKSWNLYKNDYEGWDEVERRLRYFWNR